ncbi:hypothetical protein NC653_024281 [Populus alba x Populus x berolinensis]|uniref:Uncharacterized protein n=1 Tax=Populus alba x Populus x berolinensis TaxID=444605 RepID=A0AAD6M9D7_9ROSI|nr:hypothetical protein NC653_024281 [Populus alba x Populus x berolinensis]
MAHSVSTVGSLQLISTTHSQEFVTLQQHTTHLIEEYERLYMDYDELCRMAMDMRSQMGVVLRSLSSLVVCGSAGYIHTYTHAYSATIRDASHSSSLSSVQFQN